MTAHADRPLGGRRADRARRPGGPLRAAPLVAWCGLIAAFDASAQAPAPPVDYQYPTVPNARPADNGPTNTGQRAFRLEPWVEVEGTLTSNANFDRSSEKKSDFVITLTPGFRVSSDTAHTTLRGVVSVPMYLYARTGGDNDRAIPSVHLLGNADGWDKHVFVDSSIDTSREFISPLGARPSSPVVNTNNEYLSQTYRISPGFRGDLGRDIRYEMRDNNIWTNASNTSTVSNGVLNSYVNEIVGSIVREPSPVGASIDFDRSSVRFTGQAPLVTQVARVRGQFEVDPQLRLTASAGYENNDYGPLTRFKGSVYGVGARWRPTERTALDANWEHRFFGSAYNVAFDHRTPRTVWTLRASRDVSTYPEQLANITPGNVNTLLNSLLSSQFPDPVQRQAAIDLLIRTYGLPPNLTSPVNVYTQRATLTTDLRAIAGLVGARNNVYFTVYRHRDETLVGSGSDPFAFNHDEQRGVNVVWSTRLDPLATLTGILDVNRATGDSLSQQGSTVNSSFSLVLTRPIGAYTDLHVGTRYQLARSDFFTDRNEYAVFAGILYRFY